MAEIGSAFISLVPSMRGFGRSVDRQVGSEVAASGKTAGRGFGRAFSAASIAIIGGVAAAGKLLGTAFEEARESQKVGAQTNAVIKSTGGVANVTARSLGNLSTSISNLAGVDDELVQSAGNVLLTFTGLRNEAGKGNKIFDRTVLAATNMAAALGTDAKSAALQLGKALNDPSKGYTKLQRSGVTFTEQQIKQIKAMQASGDKLGAQRLLLRELSKEFGGSAAAQATAGDKFKVAFGNAAEALGTALLPAVDQLLTKLTPTIVALGSKAGPAVASLTPKVTAAVAVFKQFGAVLVQNKTTVTALFAGFAAYKIIGLATAAVTAFNVALAANPIGIAVVALAALAAGLIYAYKNSETFRTLVQNLITTVVTGFQTYIVPAVQALIAKFQALKPDIDRIAAALGPAIAKLGAFAAAVLGRVIPVIIKAQLFFAGGFIQAIGTLITGLVRGVAASISFAQAIGRGTAAVVAFVSKVSSRIGAAINVIQSLPGKAAAAVGNLGSLLIHAGEELVNGLIRGITNKIGAVKAKMAELANTIKSHLPGSPVKTGPLTSWNNGGAGKRLVGLLADGLNESGPAERAASNLASRVAKAAKGKKNELKKAVAGVTALVTGGLAGSLVGDSDSVGSALDDLFEKIGKLPKKTAKALATSLTPAANALRGLSASYSSLTDQISAAADALSQAISTRDSYSAGLAGRITGLFDVSSATSFNSIIKGLTSANKTATAYGQTLQALQDAGLNQDSYDQLVQAGPAALKAAQALLTQGQEGILQVNQLEAQLKQSAAQTGTSAAGFMYQAGIDAAQGFLSGLQSQQAVIAAQMAALAANAIVKPVKAGLGIRSPSRVFAEIGRNTVAGLQQGLDTFSPSEASAALSRGLTASVSNLQGSAVSSPSSSTPQTQHITVGADNPYWIDELERRLTHMWRAELAQAGQ